MADAIKADKGADPVMAAFLSFLAEDISRAPARVKPLGTTRIQEARELTKGVTVDDSETLPTMLGCEQKPSAKPRWQLFAHPAFSESVRCTNGRSEASARGGYRRLQGTPKTKLLKRILDLIELKSRAIWHEQYGLGNTLGPAHRHWRQAKFLGRFRLFFRAIARKPMCIGVRMGGAARTRYAEAGGRNWPCSVFTAVLCVRRPPAETSWTALVKEAAASRCSRKSHNTAPRGPLKEGARKRTKRLGITPIGAR